MHTFDSPSYSNPHSWQTQQGGQRIVMLMILLLHLVLAWALLRWRPISASNEPNSRLLIQWFREEQTTLPHPTIALQPSLTSARSQTQERKGISINKSAETTSLPQTKETTSPSESPKTSEQEKPNHDDPFANPTPTTTTSRQANQIEQWRSEVNKSYKQIEAEQPLKRWLLNKKELTPMEKFARDALGATPAREIQTAEEMRPDGSRMTRVKTPRGEFCVVGPQPGRPYDVRGPEARVMSCPVYF